MPDVVAAPSLVMAALSLVAFAFCFAAPTPACAGVAFGLRGGYTDVDGHAFVGSGKIGGTPLVGLQAVLPIVPLISLVIAGEQSTKSFDFTSPTIGTLRAEGRAKWTDRALYAAARVRVPGAVGLYGGAGVGMHMRKTDLSGVVQTTAVQKADTPPGARVDGPRRAGAVTAGSPLDDFLSRAEKEANDLSWHAIAGLELSIPVVPVAVFAEGRIDDIQGSAPRSLAAYAGFNLKLP
jgi:opacity protein-like surface antigen